MPLRPQAQDFSPLLLTQRGSVYSLRVPQTPLLLANIVSQRLDVNDSRFQLSYSNAPRIIVISVALIRQLILQLALPLD
jgi:hypothetical protein